MESLNQKSKINKVDRTKYKLPTKKDRDILDIIYTLERLNISSSDLMVVKLIRTQLEDDWRTPLLNCLSGLLKKYKNPLMYR